MNLRLAMIVTVALASAPVLFAQHGVRPDSRPLTGWMTDGGDATQAEASDERQGTACMVVGPDLFRPGSSVGKAGNGSLPRWNHSLGLALGGNLACATAPTGGV